VVLLEVATDTAQLPSIVLPQVLDGAVIEELLGQQVVVYVAVVVAGVAHHKVGLAKQVEKGRRLVVESQAPHVPRGEGALGPHSQLRIDKAGVMAKVELLQKGQVGGINRGVEVRAKYLLPIPATLAFLPRP
jgi:hypothetical protein